MKKVLAISCGALSLSLSAVATDFEKAYNSFKTETFKTHVKTLSSDAFEGRAPASKGEQLTIDYMTQHFKALGVKPGNGDSYTQNVPLVEITTEPSTDLKLGNQSLTFKSDFVVTTAKLKETISIKNSELVFVGYGIVAPEYQWNDYAGVDMKGKTAVILINDPGFATQNPKMFDGNAMTYYGRWTYKYEEAARQGADAAIIIHETKPASYGWNVVEGGWTGPQFHLPNKNPNAQLLDAEMWMTSEQTQKLFAQASLNYKDLKTKAMKQGFSPVPMKINASLELKSKFKHSKSNNIIATIPGTKHSDEHIIYTAHWDHLGKNPDLEGDNIFNGALDNATGTAALLMIAEAFQKLKTPPKRSITFIAVTAEEQGLLGSKYYAANPVIPLNKTVGVINMDSLNIYGRKKDFTVVGFDKSELQDFLAKAATRQDRKVIPENSPERGGFYRSDHFSLAKFGVPALYAGGGNEALNAKEEAIDKALKDEISGCYHSPCDEFKDNWNLKASVDDMQVFFETGYLLGQTTQWPNWREGTEFKLARDSMMTPSK